MKGNCTGAILFETNTQSGENKTRTAALLTTDYGLRYKTLTQSTVPVLCSLSSVHKDSSECSLQLDSFNSISDLQLVEKLEQGLINTPAV